MACALNVSHHTLRRFRIIVIELHDLERLMDKHAFAVMRAALDRITDDFYVVHNHPNNFGGSVRFRSLITIPRVLEITFLRRESGRCGGIREQISSSFG